MGDLGGPGVLTRVLKRWEREAGVGEGVRSEGWPRAEQPNCRLR